VFKGGAFGVVSVVPAKGIDGTEGVPGAAKACPELVAIALIECPGAEPDGSVGGAVMSGTAVASEPPD
jgi:hypothetical protein